MNELLDNVPAAELREKDIVSILGDPVAGIIRIIRNGEKTHILYRDFNSGLWTVDTYEDNSYFTVRR